MIFMILQGVKNMRYSPKFFRDTMPEWKRKKDPIIARLFHRPMSYVFSSLFCEVGLTPNQVSFISLIISFLTCGCFLLQNKMWYIVGAILMNFWSITDSADGNMARSVGGKPYGDFIDATSSYAMVGFLFPALGWAVYKDGGLLISRGAAWIILIGAYTSICDTMARLFFQKMKNNTFEIQNKENASCKSQIEDTKEVSDISQGKLMSIFARIDSELSMGGWNLVAIIICAICNCLDIYILFYAIYYPTIFAVSTLYLIKKTKCLKR